MSFLLSAVGVLLRVAFFTLIERKIIGLIHYRKGPNKVLLWGVSQPITDAVKLLVKEFPKISYRKIFIFQAGPLIGLWLIIICWQWYPFLWQRVPPSINVIIILCLISLTVYSFILTRWGSNRKYSLIGGFRAISQVISYEVCLILFLLTIFYISKSYKLNTLTTIQENYWFSLYRLPLFFVWVILCIAESNRTPFDLAEGESELVSGFNVEYGGGLFALIFIREYGMIIVLSFITSVVFMGGSIVILKTFLVCFIYVWARRCFPRVRYDKLIKLAWKIALPYSLAIIIIAA